MPCLPVIAETQQTDKFKVKLWKIEHVAAAEPSLLISWAQVTRVRNTNFVTLCSQVRGRSSKQCFTIHCSRGQWHH